jgi:non-specific serine/threonine protein kinase
MGSSRQEQVVGHLPLEINTMVGRRQETADIRGLMASQRLVTLTGPGGIGKTRTALLVARSARRTFADGAWFVQLDSLRDPALLDQVVLETLKVLNSPASEPRTVLLDHLAGRRILLVLDNCEHLLAGTATLVEALLQEAAGLYVLATSRQPLGLPGEATYRINPLAVPDEEGLEQGQDVSGYAAVELFATRARTALGEFDIDASNIRDVVRLCAKLEGLPLALELAASRLRVMTTGELLRRLDDRFALLKGRSHVGSPRHHTLLAAVSWSHDLCTPAEQVLWRRASVFSGSFSLEAAETVCSGDELPREQVMDTLLELVDKSIVLNEQRNGWMRFSMLGTLREFGADRLAEAGETERLRVAHRTWTSAFLDEAGREWLSPRQPELMAELRLEKPNIRSALDFCATHSEHVRAGQQMAGACWFHWVVSDNLSEGRLWLERLLAADNTPSPERALALGTTAFVSASQGDTARGGRAAAECEQLALEFAEPTLVGYGVHMQALCALFGGEPALAEQLYRRAQNLYVESDAPESWQLALLTQYAAMHALQGDVAVAADLFQEIETASEGHGELSVMSYAAWGRGLVSYCAGEHDVAEKSLLRSIEMTRQFHDILGLALALDALAWVLAAKGDASRAARVVGAASQMWSTFGPDLFGSDLFTTHRAQCEATARQLLGDAAYDDAVRQGVAAPLDDTLRGLLEKEQARLAATPRVESILSRREREVAGLVAEGLTNQEIAERLVISPRTAEGHVENALRKLDFRSRAQIATWFTAQDNT